MTDEISILVSKVHGVELASKPATHLRVKVDTDLGPLVVKITVSATNELRAQLAQLPAKITYQTPAEKL